MFKKHRQSYGSVQRDTVSVGHSKTNSLTHCLIIGWMQSSLGHFCLLFGGFVRVRVQIHLHIGICSITAFSSYLYRLMLSKYCVIALHI